MRHFAAVLVHIFEHVLTVVAGMVLVIIGLAMTFSIVFAIPGMVVLFIGGCVLVGGLFAHAMARRKSRA